MDVELLPIERIKPYDKNPRKNDAAVAAVVASIKEFGFKVPLVIDSDGVIITGHTRYKAAKELGLTELPCIVADDLTPEQVKAYRLADNKVAEIAEWNLELLENELEELAALGYELDMAEFGFELSAEELGTVPVDDDGFIPDIPENPIAKPGDIWTLGQHRLMCGDSTKPEDIAKLMGGKPAEMTFTDPPWNIALNTTAHPHYKKRASRQIINDNMSSEEFLGFIGEAFKLMYSSLAPGGMVYVVMSQKEWGALMQSMEANGFHWSSTVIWNKDTFVLSRKDYHTKYEAIWYGWKDDAARRCPLKDREQSDVWDVDRPRASPEHPTMKPLELVSRAILNSSKPDDIILDQFGGAGATLIASEQTGRICRMMEIDPKYINVIVDRYSRLMDNGGEGITCERDGQTLLYTDMVQERSADE